MQIRPVIIDNYDSFTYNLVQLVERSVDVRPVVMLNDCLEKSLLDAATHILLSPGPGIPGEANGMMQVIRAYHQTTPILGICLGHQALAEFFGTKIYRLPRVEHGVAAQLQVIEEHSLFEGISSQSQIGRYHSWAVSSDSLPKNLKSLAHDENGINMAFAHQELPVYGVQFHPESFLTTFGIQLMRNFFLISK